MSDICTHGNGKMLNQTKPLELLFGALIAAYGSHLLMSSKVFDLLAYKIMSEIMTETRWGMIAVLIGVVRIVAVLVNGRVFYTPLIRCVLSILSSMFWLALVVMMVATASFFGAKLPAGVAYYPVYIGFEGWCVIASAYDMKRNLMLRAAIKHIEAKNAKPA